MWTQGQFGTGGSVLSCVTQEDISVSYAVRVSRTLILCLPPVSCGHTIQRILDVYSCVPSSVKQLLFPWTNIYANGRVSSSWMNKIGSCIQLIWVQVTVTFCFWFCKPIHYCIFSSYMCTCCLAHVRTLSFWITLHFWPQKWVINGPLICSCLMHSEKMLQGKDYKYLWAEGGTYLLPDTVSRLLNYIC